MAGRGRERLLELRDETISGDGALHGMQQRLPGVFIDRRRDLDRLDVSGGIELEVIRPQHIGASAMMAGTEDIPLRGL